ncbi:Anti-sigma-B factor antagonist [Rhodobacteraceae bacterium THAF1]|uniref:STAS domain-containing protein n=1 Tax=Palleronia sp. THAF1 TaxID=2587842 RepID=UPI000F3B91A2|nr:STAS domain-containing protein [Palleronia sp. THAF1]QFU09903.1 Anti-sigma-B factor antagonist [Palleronia sp. THAF1]VDC17194.1 Anti-sigma-B factor antagonist [Rhodobacteraceae bacterium THAF1]
MQIDMQTRDNVLMVRPMEDRLDAAVAVQFKDAMRDLPIDAPARVILDMGGVQFLDSSGLGAVIGAMKLLAPARRLEIADLTPAVAKVFKLTRMENFFTIHASASDVSPPQPETSHAS